MKKKKINFLLNICIILVVLGLVLYFSLRDNYDMIIKTILNMNCWWFLLGVLLFCLYRILIGYSHYNVVKLNKENVSFIKSVLISFIILFFNGVTPFASGGGPMEIYYLHKERIGLTKSTNITLQNFIIYQIALVIVGIIAIVYNYCFSIFPANSLIKRIVIIGFTVNTLVLVVTYILSFGKKLNEFICVWGLNLVGKTGLIKDIDGVRKKINQYLTKFHKNAEVLKKHKVSVILNIILNIFAIFILYMIPYVIFRGMGKNDINLIEVIVSTAYVMTIGSFVPIPGGTGGIEYGYVFFFGHLIKGSILNASMLIWRFITYYLGMIIGALALAFYRKKEKECE